MYPFIKKLPEDIVLIISSYYGSKILRDLSNEINDQRLLYAIKNKEYFDQKFNVWHLDIVGNLLKDHPAISAKLKKEYDLSIWKDKDRLINKMWWSFSSNERKKIVEKNFSYAFDSEAELGMLPEIFHFHFGYHMM